MELQGLDISNWKPDFDPLAVDYDFLVVQTTWGAGEVTNNGIIRGVWPGADAKIQAARRRGKLWGFMHYLRGVGAKAEARFAVEHNRGYLGQGLASVDWEADDNPQIHNPAYLSEFLGEFIRLSGGIKPLVYCMQSMLGEVAPVAARHDCGLWVAQYASDTTTGYQPHPWNEHAYNCVIRQYSSHGRLPGYAGDLDLDKAYITAEQWSRYANPNHKTDNKTPAQTIKEAKTMAVTHILFRQEGTQAIYIAYVNAGTYRKIGNMDELNTIKHILTKAGANWKTWAQLRGKGDGYGDVRKQDMRCFGIEVKA